MSDRVQSTREFFRRSEAPINVTVVIIATLTGVIIVAIDTSSRTKIPTAADHAAAAASARAQ